MSPLAHRIYIFTLTSIVVLTTIYLVYVGASYYSTSMEERFYHPDHHFFKPSGIFGHGLGIVGTLLIAIGVFGYIGKKRYNFLPRLGRLKYWLEFHIFLCTIGPVMILFHTAFKFGGVVSVAFWSMVAVVASGVIGRFIYIQIPRTIEGRELSLNEIQQMKVDLDLTIKGAYHLNEATYNTILEATKIETGNQDGNLIGRIIKKYIADKNTTRTIKKILRQNNLQGKDIKKVVRLVQNELSLNNRIARLQTMQQLFKYWHVVHLPFALIMAIILIIHVAITLTFGYKWIF